MAENIDRLADLGFRLCRHLAGRDRPMNDWFRGVDGAFDAGAGRGAGLQGARRQGGPALYHHRRQRHHLPAMLDLCDAEGVDKFYLSHLVYAGRGDKHRGEDTAHDRTRKAMDQLIDRAWVAVAEDQPLGDRDRQQ
jgi:MoaA/NifB/PqqE/SkfB family radical SAM enzyme